MQSQHVTQILSGVLQIFQSKQNYNADRNSIETVRYRDRMESVQNFLLYPS